MRRKRWSYLIACVVLAGGLAAPGTYTKVYAQDYENVEYVTSVSELRDSMDEADVVNSADVMDRGADVDAAAMYSCESADIYSLRRIILYTDEVPETYGATTVICYDKYDYYVLGYDTEEATKQAYEKLQEEYEPDKCMLDQVIYSEDVLADSDLDSNSYAAQRNVDAMLAASETYKAVSWGTRYMGMDRLKAEVSEYKLDAKVNVAVIDTGVNSSDTLFEGRINEEGSMNCCEGEDRSDYGDNMGHGSHVAGIIADATPDNVQLTIIKCFTSQGATTVSTVQQGIMAALDSGADVINMSFCFYGKNANDTTRAMLDELLKSARENNVIMCVAAGNTNSAVNNWEISDVEGVSYPADSSDVITVSALMQKAGTEETADRIAADTVEFDDAYSYYGDAVDFSAPGTYITSAWKTGTNHGHVNTGTSMAAPHISAAAAYVKLAEPGLGSDQLKDRLISYSVDLGTAGKDKYCGYGCPYMADYFADTFAGETPEMAVGDCGVSTLVNTKDGLRLTWTAADGATGYRIYRRSVTDGYTCIAELNGADVRSYTDKTAVPGSRYRYAVKGVQDSLTGKASVTKASVRLTQPKYTVKNEYSGVKVSWNKVKGASGYKIYRKAPGQNGWKQYKVLSAGTLTFVDKNVTNYRNYTYTVKAFKGTSASSYDTAGVRLYRMPGCKAKKVRSNSRKTMDVTWNKVRYVSGYQIQYSTSSKFDRYKVATINKSTKLRRRISSLFSGKYYYVRMRTYRRVGGKTIYGGWSSVQRVKVK